MYVLACTLDTLCHRLQSALVSKRGRKSGSKVCFVMILCFTRSGLSGSMQTACRDFVLTQYQHLKKANPKFPILIRECSGAEARLIARYGNICNRPY